jgi:hypothetical protein
MEIAFFTDSSCPNRTLPPGNPGESYRDLREALGGVVPLTVTWIDPEGLKRKLLPLLLLIARYTHGIWNFRDT